tara:strand:+ start:1078 stop:4374 length:3297 start_codon:yes stop_codon:yes gene_type:complete
MTPENDLSSPRWVLAAVDPQGRSTTSDFLRFPLRINQVNAEAVFDTMSTVNVITEKEARRLGLKWSSEQSEIVLGDGSSSLTAVGRTTARVMTKGKAPVPVHFVVVKSLIEPMIIGLSGGESLGFGVVGLPLILPENLETKDERKLPRDIESGASGVLGGKPSAEDERLIQSRLQDAFDKNEALPSNSCLKWDGSELTLDNGNSPPVYTRSYPIPEKWRLKVLDRVREWADLGFIEPSTSKWNHPLVAARKVSGGSVVQDEIRLCISPKALNGQLGRADYNLPQIQDLFGRLQGFTRATALDGKSSFHMLSLRKSDRPKTAFTAPDGSRWQWTRAFFGLSNIASHFQWVMEAILEPWRENIIIYIDDVIVYSAGSLEEHLDIVKGVLDRLTDVGFKLSLHKCQVAYKRLRVLGYILEAGKRTVDPRKIDQLKNIPAPKTGKALASWLGLVNYLRDVIPLYSSIAAPLERLRSKRNLESSWGEAEEEAFKALKNSVSTLTELHFPDWSAEFNLDTDASQTGVGWVLYQSIDGQVRYISFGAKALTGGQVNYPAHKRELLALITALQKSRHYLYGRHFTVYTDHQALVALNNPKRKLDYMSANWLDQMLEFDFTVVHKPGAANIIPHHLSHVYAPFMEKRKGRERETESLAAFHVTEVEVDDSDASKPAERLREAIATHLQRRDPMEKRDEVLRDLHASGHVGTSALFTLAWRKGFYWPTMWADAKRVTKGCMPCLKQAAYRVGFHPCLPITASFPMDHVAIDILGPLPTSLKGYNFILVVVDIATRFSILRAMRTKTMEEVAWLLWGVFSDFGTPMILQSDNDPSFVGKVVQALKEHCGIDHRLVLPYHPQANGAAEVHVKLSKKLLLKLMRGNLDCWELYVPAVQMGLNSRISGRHNSSPFAVMFGRAMRPFADYRGSSSHPASEAQLLERHKLIAESVFPALHDKSAEYAKKYKEVTDNSHRIANEIPVGALVMKVKDVKGSKLDDRWEGPFTVLERVKGRYRLQSTAGELLKQQVGVDQLRLLEDKPADDQANGQAQRATAHPTESWSVNRVLDHRGEPGNREFLVEWAPTWNREDDFDGTDAVLQYFRKKRRTRK